MPDIPTKRFLTGEQALTIASQMRTKYDVTVTAGEYGGTENEATESGDTYINVVEGGANKGGVHLVPGDNTSIVSDGLGNVTIQSNDTTYGLELHGNTLELVEGGTTRYVGLSRGTLAFDPDTGRYDNDSLEAWLSAMADGLIYGVDIPKGSATTCTKTDANASFADPIPGVTGTPAVDPYVNVGPFFFVEVNGGVDPDGTPYVTSIRNIDDRFARDGSNGDVWILTPVLKWSYTEDAQSCHLKVSDTKYDANEYQPKAFLPDGTLRPYMLYAKYAGGMYDGRYASVSGVKPRNRDVSHNTLITICADGSTGYSARSVADDWYLKVMFLIKYATKNSQSVMQGCSNYNYQYAPTVAETGVKRVILSNANANNLLVGSAMMLGSRVGASDNDRNRTQNFDIFDGAVITSIEPYDAANKAVYFDVADAFDTDTDCLLSTSPWFSGSCDGLVGDGSAVNNRDGKSPLVIQGIETMVGMYEVVGDVIISSDGSTGWIPFINTDSRNEATSLTANYASTGLSLPVDSSDSWKYPLYPENGNGLLFGTTTGGSQSVGLCDGHYTNKVTTTGLREWLALGALNGGGGAGLWFVHGNVTLGNAFWHIGSRLSANGRSRG